MTTSDTLSKEDKTVAMYETYAFRIRHKVEILEQSTGIEIDTLHITGDHASNELLCELLATITNRTLIQSGSNSIARGAGYAAGVASGYWDSIETLAEQHPFTQEISPDETANYEATYTTWLRLVNERTNAELEIE